MEFQVRGLGCRVEDGSGWRVGLPAPPPPSTLDRGRRVLHSGHL